MGHNAAGRPHKDVGFERVVFFSDAIFAIAITILVLDLRLQVGPHDEILFGPLLSKLIGFVVSFSVTGIYWLTHHRLFKTLARESAALRVTNLVFMASVVFLAFPTTVISEYPAVTWSVIFYALSVATTGLLFAVLILVGRRSALMQPEETQGGTVTMLLRALSPPLVFSTSCILALSHPLLAMLYWMIMPFVSFILSFIGAQIGAGLDRKALARDRDEGASDPGPLPQAQE